MRILKTLFVLSIISAPLCCFSQGSVTVKVPNIKVTKGFIHIGLYKSGDDFPFQKGVSKTYIVKVKSNSVSYTIYNLPKGYYAIGIFHDENSDGKCNKFIGIPTESYGFSNNRTARLTTPKYKDAKFYVNAARSLSINLLH